MLTPRKRLAASSTIMLPRGFFSLHFTKPYTKSEPVHFLLTIIRDEELLAMSTAILERNILRRPKVLCHSLTTGRKTLTDK